MKRPVLFIGYETSLQEEIKDFLKDREGEVLFTDTLEETLHLMNSHEFDTVILNMQQLEDTAILRYINLHFQQTHVLVMPGRQLREAIPTLAKGRYKLLHEPFRLEDLKMLF